MRTKSASIVAFFPAPNFWQREIRRAFFVSHETIYRYIKEDKRQGGDLWCSLRSKKPYRKRSKNGENLEFGKIKNRVSIEKRPEIVNEKTRLGDWEGDTVIGKGQKGALVTLVDRTSRFLVARPLPNKAASGVTSAIVSALSPYKRTKCKTITFDNGKEFTFHEIMAEKLNTDIYFAHPYCSWERGLNENTNGLLREYFPKKMPLDKVSEEELAAAVEKINHRPRKSLGWKTPYEVFFNKTTRITKRIKKVALRI